MQIESTLKPSSLLSRLGPTAVVSSKSIILCTIFYEIPNICQLKGIKRNQVRTFKF